MDFQYLSSLVLYMFLLFLKGNLLPGKFLLYFTHTGSSPYAVLNATLSIYLIDISGDISLVLSLGSKYLSIKSSFRSSWSSFVIGSRSLSASSVLELRGDELDIVLLDTIFGK